MRKGHTIGCPTSSLDEKKKKKKKSYCPYPKPSFLAFGFGITTLAKRLAFKSRPRFPFLLIFSSLIPHRDIIRSFLLLRSHRSRNMLLPFIPLIHKSP